MSLGEDPVFHRVEDCDECPGEWDPPGHLKLKTEKLCGYCSLKEKAKAYKERIIRERSSKD